MTAELTYKLALEEGQNGWSERGLWQRALLAMLCQTLAGIHAINPSLVYQGAIRMGIDSQGSETSCRH
jgi:hypothetical protein